MSLRTLIITLALIAFLPSVLAADVPIPPGRFPLELDYYRAYRTAVETGDIKFLPSTGPYYYSEMLEILDQSMVSPAGEYFGNLSDTEIKFFSIVSEKAKSEKSQKTRDLFSLSTGFNYQPADHFGAVTFFSLDREKAVFPEFTGKKWRGLAGDIETAALYYKNRGLSLALGRQRVFWGPRPVNLILSESAEPLDMFSANYRKGRLEFNFLFARLDQSRPDSADFIRFPGASFTENRYLAGHRLTIRFHRTFRLGIFETVVYGGQGRSPELYYLNPLHPFHAVQLNENTNDNTIIGLDFEFYPIKNVCVYSQLIVDDFQIDRKSQSDQEPDEIGLMAGLFRAGSAGSFSPDINLEYVRITNRTYHQVEPRNRYLYRDRLLSHPLGPDSDSLSLRIRFWPGLRQFVEIGLAYRRHGESSIYKSWDEPWMDLNGDYKEPFPSGIVEKSILMSLSCKGYLPLTKYSSKHLFFELEGGYGDIKNHNNIGDKDFSTSWLNISISWTGALNLNLGE